LRTSEKADSMRAMTRVAGLLFFLGSSLAVSQTADNELRVKRIVNVEYPWPGRVLSIQGDVELVASISSDGAVLGVRQVSGSDILASAAKDALSKWLFTGCKNESGCEIKVLFSFILLSGSCAAGEVCPSQSQADLPDHVTVTAKPIRAIVN
jgi:hypothetical protein